MVTGLGGGVKGPDRGVFHPFVRGESVGTQVRGAQVYRLTCLRWLYSVTPSWSHGTAHPQPTQPTHPFRVGGLGWSHIIDSILAKPVQTTGYVMVDRLARFQFGFSAKSTNLDRF